MNKIYPKITLPPKSPTPQPEESAGSDEGKYVGRICGVLTASAIYAMGLSLFFTKVLNAPPQDNMIIMLIGAVIPLLFSIPFLYK